MKNIFDSIPCKTCITLPMCRNRYLKNYRETRSPLANLYVLIDICGQLDDYLFESTINSVRARRIFATTDFIKGKSHDTSM